MKKLNHKMKIVHLYPSLMGTYGDIGNTLIIKYKLEQNGFYPKIELINPDDKIPTDGNLYILGGGEDLGQEFACELLKKGDILSKILNNSDAKLFAICAGFQIIGNEYSIANNSKKQGIELIDFYTKRLNQRAVGEVLLESEFGSISGYENHGGGTTLGKGIKPLGKVKYGIGNGFNQKTDGVITKKIIGTYLHGPVLVRNPKLLNFIIEKTFNIKIINEKNEYINKLRSEREKYIGKNLV